MRGFPGQALLDERLVLKHVVVHLFIQDLKRHSPVRSWWDEREVELEGAVLEIVQGYPPDAGGYGERDVGHDAIRSVEQLGENKRLQVRAAADELRDNSRRCRRTRKDEVRNGRHLVRHRAVEPELGTVEDEVLEGPYALWVEGEGVDAVFYGGYARQRFECGGPVVRHEEVPDPAHDGRVAANGVNFLHPSSRRIVEHLKDVRLVLREGYHVEGHRPAIGSADREAPGSLRSERGPPFGMGQGDLAEVSAGLGNRNQGSAVSKQRAPELVNLGGAERDSGGHNLLHDVVKQLCRQGENGPPSVDGVLERSGDLHGFV